VADDGTLVSFMGTVTRINNAREFTIRSGKRPILVDTDEMPYNPLDNQGDQRIEIGERVRVVGTLDRDFFERDEIKAAAIMTLWPTKSSGAGGTTPRDPANP
jgi:hypothetical protein